jgi:tRNA dimethylallyltransferase
MNFPARMVAALSATPRQVDPLAVLLLGPTGSGKTALSLALGERFSGEIVSCDSVAAYRGMDLGVAKPTRAERARLPHHMIDLADPISSASTGNRRTQSMHCM